MAGNLTVDAVLQEGEQLVPMTSAEFFQRWGDLFSARVKALVNQDALITDLTENGPARKLSQVYAGLRIVIPVDAEPTGAAVFVIGKHTLCVDGLTPTDCKTLGGQFFAGTCPVDAALLVVGGDFQPMTRDQAAEKWGKLLSGFVVQYFQGEQLFGANDKPTPAASGWPGAQFLLSLLHSVEAGIPVPQDFPGGGRQGSCVYVIGSTTFCVDNMTSGDCDDLHGAFREGAPCPVGYPNNW
jgi:hypothetical protein